MAGMALGFPDDGASPGQSSSEGFLMTGFPFPAFRLCAVLPRTKKISRSARNDNAGAK